MHRDTSHLQRGDMLLMVATSRHHGMPALSDSKDGLQVALFDLLTPDSRHRHHHPNTTHLGPPSPRGLGRCRGFVQYRTAPVWTRCCGWGRGWLGGWGGGRRVLPRPSSPTLPRGSPPPPHLPPPPHPPLPLRPGHRPRRHRDRRAQCPLLWGRCTRSRSARGTRSMRSRRSTSPSRALPRPPPTAKHVVAPPQQCPSVAAAEVLEGCGMVTNLFMRLQGVLARVFAFLWCQP